MADQQFIQDLDINLIQPNPHQPRKHIQPDQLQDLVDSIKIHGVLEPIIIAHTPAGYQIIAGERRWRSARRAGLATIPAIIKKVSPRQMLEMSIVENVQRSDLNCLERAHALSQLAQEFNLSANEIAERIGKSPSYVSNSVKLLQLPDALKDGLLGGMITEGHARALQAITDKKALIEAYKTVLKESASVRRAEELARRFRSQGEEEPKKHHPKIMSSQQIDAWQDLLHKSLGKNSKVKLRRSYRQTQVIISLKGSLDDTQAQLDKILTLAKKPNE